MEDQFVCICNNLGPLELCQWVEPHPDPAGGLDFCATKRAYICDDCMVVHWARRIDGQDGEK